MFLILLTYGFQGYGTEGESCISRKFDRETVLKLSQFFGPQLRVGWSKKNRTSFFLVDLGQNSLQKYLLFIFLKILTLLVFYS